MSGAGGRWAARALALSLFGLAGGCTMLSGASDLRIDDAPATSTSATDPDAGKTNDASAPTPPDAATGTTGDPDAGSAPSSDAATTPDATTCGDHTTAKLTSCASDGALSPSIVTCREYCASRGSCCSTTTCTYLGLQVAGTWSSVAATCSLSPDYQMTSCDEPIRGSTPGYFRCCCY